MYHHFAGKEDLAATAMQVTAAELLRKSADDLAVASTSALDRLKAYLLRHREVMRGCPVGRMAGDPDVLESHALHGVVAATFDTLHDRIEAVIRDGIASGELQATLDPAELADTVLAVVQGGYVLARAAGNPEPFDRAVQGAVALLTLARDGEDA
jgi:AcrR family transcriptional regulator